MESRASEFVSRIATPDAQEGVPPYIDRLVAAIQAAPSTPSEVSGRAFSTGGEPRGSIPNKLFQLLWKKKRIVDTTLGINSNESTVTVTPVNVARILDEQGLEHVLVHEGFVVAGKVDNVDQVTATGVFGNPSKEDATYVKVHGSKMIPNVPDKSKQDPVLLYLDAYVLQQQRDMYTDTEPLWSNLPSDVLGESFFITSGIPANAIIGVGTRDNTVVRLVRKN